MSPDVRGSDADQRASSIFYRGGGGLGARRMKRKTDSMIGQILFVGELIKDHLDRALEVEGLPDDVCEHLTNARELLAALTKQASEAQKELDDGAEARPRQSAFAKSEGSPRR